MPSRRTIYLFCLYLILLPLSANAEQLPLWDIGLGVGTATFPDYRGSDETQTYVLPIPYIIYRGKRWNIDRRGVRGLLFTSERITLNLSGDFGVPSNSEENETRAGMPDLDPAFHVGPSLEFLLYESATKQDTLKIKLPAQWVMVSDLTHFRTAGWFFLPHLNFVSSHKVNFGFALGPIFATREYHKYYYGIAPKFATPERPAYDASGGYSGTRLSMTLSRRISDIWLGMFVRYENLEGSAFEDSPLFQQNYSLVSGVGVSWIFWKSKRRAEAPVRAMNEY